MFECRVPNQYYYGFNISKQVVFFSKEVTEFILNHSLKVTFQGQDCEIRNAEAYKIYHISSNGPYTNSSSIILVKGEDKDIITLFRMTF